VSKNYIRSQVHTCYYYRHNEGKILVFLSLTYDGLFLGTEKEIQKQTATPLDLHAIS
jgi:hypothetical protein